MNSTDMNDCMNLHTASEALLEASNLIGRAYVSYGFYVNNHQKKETMRRIDALQREAEKLQEELDADFRLVKDNISVQLNRMEG